MSAFDPKTWTRVGAVLREALELGASERDRFLDRACGDDVELRREVQALLDADESAGDFLSGSAGEFAADLLDEVEAEQELEDIPPYHLRELIGRGGMGSVYLAERSDGEFEQKVALKIIPPHRAEPDLARRFRQERQILASLVHPGIARLYDGGVTEDGRPFFAMEYVEGVPLTQHAEEHRMDVEARVRLFEDVCDPVEYAQQRLVVHRDLKPGNILVTQEGEVKLLDFGIAKLLDDPLRSTAEQTQDAARMLTPEYAAPEQLRGEAVSTATDVYALGAILYELLSGKKPHGRGLADVISQRLGDEPTTRLSQAAMDPALRRRLRGDLENIVAKALEVDAARRYRTAGALLDDLRRYRQGLPVSAAAPTWSYRANKFVRRNVLGVSAAAMLVLVLLVGTGLVLRQSRIATREARRAQEAKEFLVNVFASRDPAQSGGQDPPASELLARGAARIRAELGDEPELRAELLAELGRVYRELGQYAEARRLYRDALSTLEEMNAPARDRARALIDISGIAIFEGHAAEAESLLALAEPMLRDRETALYSSWMANHGAALRVQGRYDEAEPDYRGALALDRRLHGVRSLPVALSLNNLYVLLSDLGREAEGLEALREATEIRREELPPHHPDLAAGLHNLGAALRNSGELEESEAAFEEAIEIRRVVYEGSHPLLAGSIRGYGMTLQRADRLEEAEAAYLEAYEMARARLGDQHETVALALNDLATIAFYRDDLKLSADRFRQSADIFEANLSPTHPTVLTLRSNIATIEARRGAYAEAEEVYLEVLRARREQFDEDHPSVIEGVRNVAIARRLQGDASGALELHRQALAAYERTLGSHHQETAWTRVRVAETLCELGRPDEAEAPAREAVASFQAEFPDGHRRTADALRVLGRALLEMGRLEEALTTLRESQAIAEAQAGVDHSDAIFSRCTISLCLLRAGKREEASAIAAVDLPALQDNFVEAHPDRRRLERELAELAGQR